ncbi:MAG TPA: hypothetical protein DCP69_06020 [Candidatus Omnitrophica bacterium]|nr:hypothetical protein [Candidatus Omnitrophota bacterium]
MSCRIACQPEPRRHWPSFSPADLPSGLAECLVCRDWITAVDFLEGVCAGWTEIEGKAKECPVVAPMLVGADPDGGRLIDGSPIEVAPLSGARDLERERTLGMIRRCAERQW